MIGLDIDRLKFNLLQILTRAVLLFLLEIHYSVNIVLIYKSRVSVSVSKVLLLQINFIFSRFVQMTYEFLSCRFENCLELHKVLFSNSANLKTRKCFEMSAQWSLFWVTPRSY